MKEKSEDSLDTRSQVPATSTELISRREWFKAGLGGAVGIAVSDLIDVPAIKAATQEAKLSQVSEFTTSCNFCSCGCGMIASVREGKLISMEGDYDHIVNRGSLCVKGISMFATHTSPNRLATPRYRAPGSDHWEDITWKEAVASQTVKMDSGEVVYVSGNDIVVKTFDGKLRHFPDALETTKP
jgi:anaerobic selenocysteine-containing dehydrogenase